MSESRMSSYSDYGESRSYSSYTPSYSSYGESRSSSESRTSSPSYQANYGESRESGESRGSSYTPKSSSKTTKRKMNLRIFHLYYSSTSDLYALSALS